LETNSDSQTSNFQTIKPFFSLLYIFAAVNAFGYIDLGTGSYIYQIAIASFVGGIFALKLYWKKICAFITKIKFHKRNP
jgi:hypothetical protein